MFGLRARGIVLLVTGIVVSIPLARAGKPTESGREVMSGSTASQTGDSRSASDAEASACSHPVLRSELLAMVEKDHAVRGRINAEGETPDDVDLPDLRDRVDGLPNVCLGVNFGNRRSKLVTQYGCSQVNSKFRPQQSRCVMP